MPRAKEEAREQRERLAVRAASTEIPYKQWRYEQSAVRNVTDSAIAMQVKAGKYPGLRFRRVNKRVVFVISSDKVSDSRE